MTYIGIDPGAKGAIAIISDDGIEVYPYSSIQLIGSLRDAAFTECKCCLEKVGAMPGQGVTSMFSFGKNVGFIMGCLESFGIPYQEVPPKKWKAEFGLNSDKAKSIEVCQRLFPSVSLLPTPKCRVPNDGMAEALLMAEYARRKL